jgi:hypothetical protein
VRDLIDLIVTHGPRPSEDLHLLDAVAGHAKAVRDSLRGGDRALVEQAETVVRTNPTRAFGFDAAGAAALAAAGHMWHAGRFEPVSIGELRHRVRRRAAGAGGAGVRLWVLEGASPVTDIGSLQATSGSAGLFQVASQFNCLESPGPYLTPVASYFGDPTQGPRASISAFPATLLRHYAAPGPGGERFVQERDGRQIELLADACGPGAARNGYFTGAGIAAPASLVGALEDRFDAIRVGVHDDVQVVLGADWDGAVEDSARRRIAQVFTSTVAGGGYGGERYLGASAFRAACRQLLRAAYLGTLLAAAWLGRTRVALTLIGGGVFRNPVPLIWDAIRWALEEIDPLVTQTMDVVVNGRNLGSALDLAAEVLPTVRTRGGAVLRFDGAGCVGIQR